MSGGTTGTASSPATPVAEPLTVDEVMRHCRIDQANYEQAPGVITAALASPAVAGNVTAGAHRYRATFVTDDGETEGGTVSAAVTVANAAVNGKIELTAIPVGGSLVTSRKIYRTAAGGSTYLLLTTLADNTTTTYTDNIADASLGAGAPTSNTTSDPQLGMLIAAARNDAELQLHRKLITQTVDQYFDSFPTEFVLPPLSSVTSIIYRDTNGDEQTLSTSYYRVDAVSVPARITEAYGYSWPSTRDMTNAVRVRYVAGYGARADVPSCIKQWMLLRIKHWYDNPMTLLTSGAVGNEFPHSYIDGLLDSERVFVRT